MLKVCYQKSVKITANKEKSLLKCDRLKKYFSYVLM